MDIRDLDRRLGRRFDNIEKKLDDHLERVSKLETNVIWIKGHINLTTVIFTAIIGALVTAYINL